jgi:predicted RNA-binding Zn-ribbon protein involved in translation (DUF1610 family)
MKPEQNFAEKYKAMSETELMGLAHKYDDLMDVAQAALRAEFARRGLEPPLIEEEDHSIAEEDDPDLVTVGQYRDLAEAFVARAALEEAGIDCFLRDENMVRTDWLLSNAVGGMRLQVAAKDQGAAEELLSGPAPGQFELDSGEEFVQPVCPRCGSADIVANDPDRKVMAVSMLIKFPIPHSRPSKEEWKCMNCGCVWADDEERENQAGALR